ncbi:unnamed protein product [Oreochromis niloticus]|nr:unnamed protein product [Mustela putorius furo]
MKSFLPNIVIRNYGTFVAVVVIFIHNYVLDRDMQCTCKEDKTACGVYFFLPFFVLSILQLWMDDKFTRIWKYSFDWKCEIAICCNTRFIIVLFHHIIKAFCFGSLWILALLIDGDWYVCCLGNDKGLACKNEKTDDERTKIAEKKNFSMLA